MCSCEMALVACKNYYRSQSAANKSRGEEWRRILINEVEDYACACVDSERLEKRIEEEREVFENDRIVPDLLLGPPGFKLFLAMEMMGQGVRTGYETFDPQGRAVFNEGPRAAGILRGNLVVFESRSFNNGTGGPSARPLERPTTIGECYPMGFGYRRGEVLNQNANMRYATSQRDVLIYDLNADEYKRVSFAKAFLYSYAFGNSDTNYAPDEHFGEMVKDQNEEMKDPNLADVHRDEFDWYLQRASQMDAMGGEEKATRRLPMMIAHDVAEQRYFVPTTLGQMDLDVINTADFVQVAQTIVNRPAEERKDIIDTIEACVAREMQSVEAAVEKMMVAVPSESPAVVIEPTSYAAAIFGALPLAQASEATLYAPIDTREGKLGATPGNNLLGALIANLNAEASSVGEDNDTFKSVLTKRRQIVHGVVQALGASANNNIIKTREALVAAIKANVTKDGSFKSGKSHESLVSDLEKVNAAAKTAQPATGEKLAQSQVLHKYLVKDTALNPTLKIKHNELSSAAEKRIAGPLNEYAKSSKMMEERLLLHGGAEGFDARNPSGWLEEHAAANSTRSDLLQTEDVVRQFDSAHLALHKAVGEVMGTALSVLTPAASSAKKGVSYDNLVASMGKSVDAWSGNFHTSAAAEYDSGLNTFMQPASFPPKPGMDESSVFGAKLTSGAFQYRISQAALAKVPTNLRDVYDLVLRIPNSRRCWEMLLSLNVHVPINLNLWRLFIRNRMQTVIMMRSGLETMGTTYGHANMVVSGEGSTKTLEAHLTFQFGSIVWGPKGVRHLNNVMPRAHLGGWNTEFIESPDGIFDVAEEDRESLIVTIAPITENSYQWPVNFVPKQSYVDSARGSAQTYKDKIKLYGTHSSAAFYEKLWGFEDWVKFSEKFDTFSTQYKKANTVAYQGNYRQFSPSKGDMSIFRRGNGHAGGKKAMPGCRAVYEGKAKMFPDMPMHATSYA